jgi:hypothetical protein
LLHVRAKAGVVDGSIEHRRRGDPVGVERGDDRMRLPMTAGVRSRSRTPRRLRPYRRTRSVVTPHSSMNTYWRTSCSGSQSRQRRRSAATSGRRSSSPCILFEREIELVECAPDRRQAGRRPQRRPDLSRVASDGRRPRAESSEITLRQYPPAKLRWLQRRERARLAPPLLQRIHPGAT